MTTYFPLGGVRFGGFMIILLIRLEIMREDGELDDGLVAALLKVLDGRILIALLNLVVNWLVKLLT